MKISIFTPAHDLTYIQQAYDSIVNQTDKDWEWIVLLNGQAKKVNLSGAMVNDTRVKISYSDKVNGVGDAKAQCLKLATGTHFLELDHDDLLHPEALKEVSLAFNQGASFVYSNTCRISENGDPEHTEYNLLHGWKYRPFQYLGKNYKECVSFDPTPQSMSYIWYMPNHLRAFTRELYTRSGGYNSNLAVCDDQDLMQRMYICNSGFSHIDKPLYFQRIHRNQTQVVLNKEIQSKTVELYKHHINDIILSWSNTNHLMALDMGAAHQKKKGYKGVDMRDRPGVDFICDCNQKLPFDDNSVGVIRAVDFMEHIKDQVHLMNEFHRVLAHGGMLLSMTPSTDGRGAFQDPTHVSFWNQNSFWYYTRSNIRNFVPEIKARFQVSYIDTGYPDLFCQQNNIYYVTANLSAIKGNERLPGVLEI